MISKFLSGNDNNRVLMVSSSNYEVITICDLDHTLVSLNTTNELLKIVNIRKFRVISIILIPLSLLGLIFKRDLTKQIMIKLILYGISKYHIEKLSSLLYKRIKLSKKINSCLLSMIQNLKLLGPVILLTASLDVIASTFKELGFTYVVGSPTFYVNGRLAGFYDLYQKKYKIIKNVLSKSSFKKIIVLDDSPESEICALCNKEYRLLLFKVK